MWQVDAREKFNNPKRHSESVPLRGNMADTDRIVQEIIGQASGAQPNPMRKLEIAVEAMDEGLMRIGEGMQRMAQGLDMAHFKILMILEILIDKGVVTKEEVEGVYKQKVQVKLDAIRQRQQEEMQKAIEQAQQKIQNNAGVKVRELEPEPEVKSDVVLPSEQHKTVKF